MLKYLKIKNYALIDSLETEFFSGLNIITGETGAGKSILIEAFGLVLGERASADAIRTGEERAIVEAIFEIKNNKLIQSFLKLNEIEILEDLILRREISTKGSSRSFINDSPVSLNTLKSLGDLLVDLHGQHDHQSILREETHINFLDDFAGNEIRLQNFKNNFTEFSSLIISRDELKRKENELKEKKELYQFQLKEILEVNPSIDEEEKLEQEKKIGDHAEKIHSLAEEIYLKLYDSDNSALSILSNVKRKFEELSKIDESFKNSIDEIISAEAITKELAHTVDKYRGEINFSDERLEEIRQKLGALMMLKKKFGGSIETVLAFKEKLQNELLLSENFEAELSKLDLQIIEKRESLAKLAKEISAQRKTIALNLEKDVEKSLVELGIANGKFKVEILNIELENNSSSEQFVKINSKKIELTQNGIDAVQFFLSANIGEKPKKLTEVASGGEVSRIMLSLKSALANADKVSTLIFDEIDTGVSGRIGFAVGKKLQKLSKTHQIISITHLAQIAALAQNHFAVEKIETKNRTTTQLKKLNQDERISEIAKLLSGEKITESSLKSAKEMISQV